MIRSKDMDILVYLDAAGGIEEKLEAPLHVVDAYFGSLSLLAEKVRGCN